MPYLIVKDALGFRDFAVKVFNAQETNSHLRETGEIMHGELQIEGSTVMYAQAISDWPPATANMFLYVPNVDESFEKALAEGAEVVMPVENKDYGRTCGVKDPNDNVWWITSVITE